MILRQAEPGDVAAMAAVESVSWPGGLAATEDQIRARVEAYREGQWVALHEGRIVAVAASQRITGPFLATNQSRYDLITDGGRFTRSHYADGEIF